MIFSNKFVFKKQSFLNLAASSIQREREGTPLRRFLNQFSASTLSVRLTAL